jgi:hypothetical protein
MDHLKDIRKLFTYYKALGDRAISQVDDQALLWQPSPDSNSIALVVKHLHGNMISRWTDFLTTDGEKPWRNRDDEFENPKADRTTMLKDWEAGWQCLFAALDQLEREELERIIYIRNQGHTVLEALHRQLAHYAYHVGQIVFLAKLLAGEGWTSLSIPKHKSTEFNKAHFDEPATRSHFTDEFREEK